MKNQKGTWIIKNSKGEIINTTSHETGKEVRAIYWGKLKDIVKLITLKEFKEMATLEFYNPGDGINHRPITKEQIEKLLEEI